MADPGRERRLLDDTAEVHTISDSTYGNGHVQDAIDEIREEFLEITPANGFDTSTISYAVATEASEVCDTGQNSTVTVADVNNDNTTDIAPHDGVSDTHMSCDTEAGILVHDGEPPLSSKGHAETIFSNGAYAVDIGSLTEGQIISLPNDMVPPHSVTMSQQSDESQTHTVGGDEAGILSAESQDLIQHMERQFVQPSSVNLLQGESSSQLDLDLDLVENEAFNRPQAITVTVPPGMTMTQDVLQNVIQQVQAQHLAQQQTESAILSEKKESLPTSDCESPNNSVSFSVVSPTQQISTAPPLGSSQNPIRIIQQGNRYTPMQQLTTDQLQQIMQVVQQQHVSKNAQDNGGTIIFNPQTNTRIMYRVIYPSELHKAQNASAHTTYQLVRPTTSTQEQQTNIPHQKRQYRKRKDVGLPTVSVVTGEEVDRDKGAPDAPELSKEEKEERKKHRPRTRSGRVSKPPKHMIQDYKHIHVLDWDEDYDDSDGGYSDFKHSDEEGKLKRDGEEVMLPSPEIFPALGKPKNHKCQTCDKSYIGQAGLARHYRLNPDHLNMTGNGSICSVHNGSLDGDDSKDASPQDGSTSNITDATTEMSKANGFGNSMETFSEDSNTQDSINSTGTSSPFVKRGRGRGSFRGRGAHFKYNAQIRRKNKLKELMKTCSDEDLMEVVLPRLVTGISAWEFLLMKSEKGGSRPQVDVIYHEFKNLKRHVKQVCSDYLRPLSQEELEDDNLQCKMIKVTDKSLALCLNLEPVTYQVGEMPQEETNSFSSLHSKLSAVSPSMPALDVNSTSISNLLAIETKCENGNERLQAAQHNLDSKVFISTGGVKRVLELSPDEAENPTKKQRVSSAESPLSWNSQQSSSSIPPGSPISSPFSITAQVPPGSEGNLARSNTTSSSSTSFTISSKSQPTLVNPHSSPLSSSSTSLFKTYPKSSRLTPTTSSSAQFTSPVPKQPVSYILKASNSHPSATNAKISTAQTLPIVINATSAHRDTSQVLPYILGTSSIPGNAQKVVIAASSNKGIMQGSMPVVLAAPANQASGGTVLFTSGSPTSSHRVIVKPPAQQHQQPPPQHPPRVILTSQQTTTPSKSQLGSGISLLTPTTSSILTNTSSLTNLPRSLLNLKPTEVKVSRQLFHDTTTSLHASSSSSSSSSSINGRGMKTTETSTSDKPVKHVQRTVVVNPVSISCRVSGNNSLEVKGPVKSKSDSVHTTLALSSGHQFMSDKSLSIGVMNRSQHEGKLGPTSDIDMDQISTGVFSFTCDETGSLNNTSTDSLNMTYSPPANLTNLVTSDCVTNCVSDISLIQTQAANGSTDLVDHANVVPSESQEYETIHNIEINGENGVSLINGSTHDISSNFAPVRLKESNGIKSHLACSIPAPSSLSFTISSTTDFVNMHTKPSSPVVSPSKDTTLSPPSGHMYTIGNDLTSFQLNNQSMCNQVNGVTSILSVDDQQVDGVSVLPDQISAQDMQDNSENHILDCDNDEDMSDSLGADSGQLLMTEGTNIFQTEDGTLIIQSADGNTYQLQGAQGLSLEMVQALLSGTLDQLPSDGGAEPVH